MPDGSGQIFCQRCLAPNSLDMELCHRCGTRLMLVVEPTALRFEEEASAAGGDYDEHLLERVSALENRLARMTERLERGLELLLRHARTSYFDHLLLETLISALGESRTINARQVEERWRRRCERDAEAEATTSLLMEARGRVVAAYAGEENEDFARLVGEGFALLEKGDATQGARALERAAALAPANAPLNTFIGELYLREGKHTIARHYLARAQAARPDDRRVLLLLGLACGDEGDAEHAKEFLGRAVRRGDASYAAHYALGRLYAAESDWESALSEFKRALAARKSPEAHYVLGLVYFNLGRFRPAHRHLLKAVEMDSSYGEAFYLLGLVRLRLGQTAQAREAFEAAREHTDGKRATPSARRKVLRPEDFPAPDFFGSARHTRRRLVTGGDLRLAAALREDAFGGGPRS